MQTIRVNNQEYLVPERLTGAELKTQTGSAPEDLLYAVGPAGDRVVADAEVLAPEPAQRYGTVRPFVTGQKNPE